MKLAALSLDDPWSQRIQQNDAAMTQMFRDTPTEMVVYMEQVEFLHHGPEQRYRPYLHLRGKIEQLMPNEPLPYGVAELPYKRGHEPQLDAFYEFTDDQLAELVTKGYFTEEFTVPEHMEQLQWELPGTVDYLMVFPEYMDQVPVVFAGVRDRNDVVLTAENSGYDLDVYFASVEQSQAEITQRLEQQQRDEAPRHDGEFEDMFAGYSLDDVRAERERNLAVSESPLAPERQDVPASAFDQLVVQAEQEYQLREAAAAQEQAEQQDSIEHVYQTQIAQRVEQALGAERSTTQPDQDGSQETAETTADAARSNTPQPPRSKRSRAEIKALLAAQEQEGIIPPEDPAHEPGL